MKTVSNLVIASILSLSGAVYAQSAAGTAKPAINPAGATEKTSAAEAAAKAKASKVKAPGVVEKSETKAKEPQPMAAKKIEQSKAGAHKLETANKEQHVMKTPDAKTPSKISKPVDKTEASIEKKPSK